MRSATLLPIRMKAADTSASRAIADCTPLTVVFRSCTTAEIDTFISEVSTTSTNIAIASKRARRLLLPPAADVWDDDVAVAEAAAIPGAIHRAHPELVSDPGLAPEVRPGEDRVVPEPRPRTRLVGVVELAVFDVVAGHAAATGPILSQPVDSHRARARAVAGELAREGQPHPRRAAVERRAGLRAGRVEADGQVVRADRVRALGLEVVDALLRELHARLAVRPGPRAGHAGAGQRGAGVAIAHLHLEARARLCARRSRQVKRVALREAVERPQHLVARADSLLAATHVRELGVHEQGPELA